jgi:hypothetical protein
MSDPIGDALRRAAGRVVLDTTEQIETPIGDIGIGRGGAAAGRPRRATTNALINERIRKGARIVRSVQLRDGLSVDLDDPWS